jgi:hypothetical protein
VSHLHNLITHLAPSPPCATLLSPPPLFHSHGEKEASTASVPMETAEDDILGVKGKPLQSSQPSTLSRPTATKQEKAFFVNLMNLEFYTPTSFMDTMKSKAAVKWKKATNNKILSLIHNKTWYLCPWLVRACVIVTMFIYKLKVDVSGPIKCYKACLIAKGFTQKWGTDYDETFMPVVLLKNLHFLLFLTITLDLEIHQMDVELAFLHTLIQEEI